MRDKIAEIIGRYGITPHDDRFFLSDEILKLFPSLDGIVVEEECHSWSHQPTCRSSKPCPDCHGTGTITRQAEWGDIPEEAWGIMLRRWLLEMEWKGETSYATGGGRLRVKE